MEGVNPAEVFLSRDGIKPSEIFNAFLLEKRQRGQGVFHYGPELEKAFYETYLKNPEVMKNYASTGLVLYHAMRMSRLTGRIGIMGSRLISILNLDGIEKPREKVRDVAREICDNLEKARIMAK